MGAVVVEGVGGSLGHTGWGYLLDKGSVTGTPQFRAESELEEM